ncbi:SgcJ/EcaC family oxidoreductase [Sphaerisporangium fuscum]|uniref:SgcJ/EcaC family oxidoreductase n=1 Tax=Sphaerisporangium fuscum TaxID=2835868 RepID=UPI001BDD3A9B|nr:SgcJ/EcaC family oxidoreductase [Sphaerisporangium fuscum]
MKTLIHIAAAGGLGLALTGAASAPMRSPGPAADTDRAALAQLYQRQADAWAKGDAKTYAQTYTPDADFVNVTGEHMHTRAEIAERYEGFLHKQLKNTRILTMEERIDMLSPSLALILRKGCVLFGAERTCHPNTLSWNTSLVVKQAGQWLVRSFHNTLVDQSKIAPRAPKTASTLPPRASR